MDLDRKVESLIGRKEGGLGEKEGGAGLNQGRRVSFGGIHFSDGTTGREEGGNNNASVVEEIETVHQERENAGQKILFILEEKANNCCDE